ncbi:SecDF P1 head subdomain-containing protein [Actinomadura luteofluorescens]|uniref:SecDF P1 head subdomain-containing protein n=1 Tax=Actinomadura luteofluorescens TaxID=46163 RepID=UPI0030CD07B6
MGHPPPAPYGMPPGAVPQPSPSRGPGPLLIGLVAVAAAVLLAVVGLGAYLVLSDDGDDSAAASSGPVDLRVPLTFRLLASVSAPPCAGGAVTVSGASECYTLSADLLTVRRLEEVKAVPPDPARGSPGWSVALTLTSADAPGFAALTRKAADAFAAQAPGGRMAMLVGGTLVSEPAQVMQAITGGQVEINGPADRFTRAYTEDLVHRMTGK